MKPLIRKVRRVGGSHFLTIPSSLCQVYDIKGGDEIEIILVDTKKGIIQFKKSTGEVKR